MKPLTLIILPLFALNLPTAIHANSQVFQDQFDYIMNQRSQMSASEWKLQFVPQLKKLCSLDHAQSCGNLGALFASGSSGVTIDMHEAAKFYQKACALGDHTRCGRAGVLVASGYYKVKDPKKLAIKLFRYGCEKQETLSCSNLLLARTFPLKEWNENFWRGQTIRTIPLAGEKIFEMTNKQWAEIGIPTLEMGCKLQDATACANMYIVYKYGYGTMKNRAKSLRFKSLACRLGSKGLCPKLAPSKRNR